MVSFKYCLKSRMLFIINKR